MKTLIERWDGQAVVMRFDAETGTWMFIALHNMTLGPASGGTRMKIYPSPEDGLADAIKAHGERQQDVAARDGESEGRRFRDTQDAAAEAGDQLPGDE